jgi:hypothetical protein
MYPSPGRDVAFLDRGGALANLDEYEPVPGELACNLYFAAFRIHSLCPSEVLYPTQLLVWQRKLRCKAGVESYDRFNLRAVNKTKMIVERWIFSY